MYSYPLSDFTAQSLKNILFSLYSKGQLLSKAVNGQFFVPQELCDRVYNYTNPEWIVNAMKNTPDLVGIEIKDDQLFFWLFLKFVYAIEIKTSGYNWNSFIEIAVLHKN